MKFFKKSVKYVMAAATVVALGALLGGCGSTSTTSMDKKAEPLKVVATVFPVADVAKQVGGDKVDVTLLVRPGAEPHDWDPSAEDLKAIGMAKVFLYSGAGLEPTEKILAKDVVKDAKVVELSKGLELLPALEDEDEDHDHDADKKDGDKKMEEEKHEHHSDYDPHVWLDPMNVSAEVDAVVKAFSEADPANKAYYEKNGAAYKEKLAALNEDFQKFAATQMNKELIVSHQAFAYFAKRYGFQQVAIMGVSPDAEPTPERMSEIVAFSKEHHVKAIFGEELVSPKLAEAIANEIGAKVYVLNPAEGLTEEETKEGLTYLDLMKKNLETLKEALK